jgi:diketogulonate reductase-like aldo/keto reductase
MRPNLARAGRRAGDAIGRIGGTYAKSFVKMVRDRLFKPSRANALGRPSIPQHPVLARIGAQYDKSAAQVALRWLIEQETVAAIPRPGNERECRENLAIFDFALTSDDRAAIAALAGGYRVVELTHAPAWGPARQRLKRP